jgi:Kef-type K+ transport system membrane component KefB
MDIPQLISDLAIMLTTAAVVTMLFRRLRIPAILGYILAARSVGKAGSHEDGGMYESKESGEESRSEGEMK